MKGVSPQLVAFLALAPCVFGGEGDVSSLPPAALRPVDFLREVKPIFEQNCFKCHGPEKQKGGYRLDLREVALTGGEQSAPNIIPARSAESPLIHYVGGLDEDMKMPSKGDPLTAEQIGILRAWIDQGAVWPEEAGRPLSNPEKWKQHWSFQPVVRPAMPAPAGRGAIDAFLAVKLREHGLAFSPEADRRTLVRRLSFDLTGLPPTPREIDDFIGDRRPDAYEQLVERLLASPAYGERWGRHWLDVIRFGESDGYERNNWRLQAWPYRDYVIRAFNDDLPYDRFIREQLAGDAYGVDAATGFLVGTAWDVLRLIDPPAFDHQQRADELYDMVTTTSTAFLGLTSNCARCHDHKFDPISQKDFYSLTAVFQGVYHGERPMRPPGYEAIERELAKPQRRVAEIDAVLAPFVAGSGPDRTLLVEADDKGDAVAFAPGSARGQAADPGDELRLPTPSAAGRGWKVTANERREIPAWQAAVEGRFRIWLSWSAEPAQVADASYVLDRDGDPATSADQVELARIDQRKFADGASAIEGEQRWSGLRDAGVQTLTPPSRIFLRSGASGGLLTASTLVLEEVTAPGAEPMATPHLRPPVVPKANEERFDPVDAKFLRFTVLGTNSGDANIDEIEVFPVTPAFRNIANMEWGGKATGMKINGRDGNPFYLIDGVFHEVGRWSQPVTQPVWVQLEFAQVEKINRVVWSRNRSVRGPIEAERGIPVDYRIEVSADGVDWKQVASSADRLAESYRKRVTRIPTLSDVPLARAGEFGQWVAERRALQAQIAQATKFPPVYAGKFREPGPSFRLNRGEATSPKEQVPPAALAYFSPKMELPFDAPEQQRRIALAEWITNPANPLTARVVVNRLWHYHFGTGIVDTPSDLGINGGRPTHPELLDWLASELVARGWHLKDLQRLIVNSAAYRQSAAPNPAGLAADSGARFLWRFPPRRLEAEALRDAMLAVSGQLDRQAGGPGFNLFSSKVDRSKSIEQFETKTVFEPGDYRRMVYQLKPRGQVDDVFGSFDCPDAGQIAPARTSTITPLQALNLMNSPFALQEAAAFAARLQREAGADPGAAADLAFDLAFGRRPEPAERADSIAFITQHGLELFCRSIYNASEFIFIY